MKVWVKARSHGMWNSPGLPSGLEEAGKSAGGSSPGRGSSIRTSHPCYQVMCGGSVLGQEEGRSLHPASGRQCPGQ